MQLKMKLRKFRCGDKKKDFRNIFYKNKDSIRQKYTENLQKKNQAKFPNESAFRELQYPKQLEVVKSKFN